uniref:PhoLip_ATPase_N domain-containing protein n=1 Tax=Elaeophora elaphi TaxID=1147741 RepID=A0A0R3S4T8_9BILA
MKNLDTPNHRISTRQHPPIILLHEMTDYVTSERHRSRQRHSSIFVPQQPSILKKVASLISETLQTILLHYGSQHVTPNTERIVEPNYQINRSIHRYELHNYQKCSNNKITTTKYSLITFIPKNLWEQFYRIANLYFIMIAAMNWIPTLEAFNSYVSMIPVAVVFGLTALKDAYGDYRRRKLDKRMNRAICHMHWEQVIVGDFIHVSLNEIIPADILLIRSSDPDGVCFVNTSNLDGETNLKQRIVPLSLLRHSGVRLPLTLKEECLYRPTDFHAKISFEKPNNRINQMKGHIIYEDEMVEDIRSENMILRGCQLRNTSFVEGIVLYAGNESKIMMSSSHPSYKRSSLEITTNHFIVYCIAILIGMCLFTGIASMLWLSSYSPHTNEVIFVIMITSSVIIDGIINFVSSILIYQILIPLSLYLSVEFIKLFQVYFITQDINMYDQAQDRATKYQSLNIPEELGRIQYIMSDKTGTLTENLMIFRRCTINGMDYECEIKQCDRFNLQVDNVIVNNELKKRVDAMNWQTDRILTDFFITMAICNTVVVNMKREIKSRVRSRMKLRVDGIEEGFIENNAFNANNATKFPDNDMRKKQNNSIECDNLLNYKKRTNRQQVDEMIANALYEAESPDELALVCAARAYGVTLVKRSRYHITVILPRKNGQTFHILQGADSEILSSLASCQREQSMVVKLSQELLKKYSLQGLRTLCLAKRHLTINEYEEWLAKHMQIEKKVNSLTYEKELQQSLASIESNLEFLGVTAIEDRLQIVFRLGWSRRYNTRSCGLFPTTAATYFMHTEDDVQRVHGEISLQYKLNYCIVLSAKVIPLLYKQNNKLVHILQRSLSVLYYRMTPSNKAEIVRIAKKVLDGKVLAIGDGANDVPMIQCADVGIGVYGQEGMQAAMAADFAVARFKFLLPYCWFMDTGAMID